MSFREGATLFHKGCAFGDPYKGHISLCRSVHSFGAVTGIHICDMFFGFALCVYRDAQARLLTEPF